jgi:putative hemolysin
MINEIDIDSIVRSRAGRYAKFIPRWLTGLLARIIHQEFINIYLRQGRVGVDFCKGVVEYVGADVKVEGRENLPDDGQLCTFVSNHPLGAVDGVTLGWVIGEHYDSKIKYLVNDLLMNLQGLAPLCVPINKIGRQARSLPAVVEETFSSDCHVIMFPAGLCSRRQDDGTIRDIPWSKAFIVKSVQHQRNIVPIHFEGRNSDRFYSVARWCKRLHLPNFAMALLPDEMYRSRGKHYTVRIGKPIPWQTFDKTKTPVQWAAWVQEKVYET